MPASGTLRRYATVGSQTTADMRCARHDAIDPTRTKLLRDHRCFSFSTVARYRAPEEMRGWVRTPIGQSSIVQHLVITLCHTTTRFCLRRSLTQSPKADPSAERRHGRMCRPRQCSLYRAYLVGAAAVFDDGDLLFLGSFSEGRFSGQSPNH
jgi:hypothetical protein